MVRGYKMEIYKPFRSTSLREARLATIKLIDSTEDIFRSTSLREARQLHKQQTQKATTQLITTTQWVHIPRQIPLMRQN